MLLEDKLSSITGSRKSLKDHDVPIIPKSVLSKVSFFENIKNGGSKTYEDEEVKLEKEPSSFKSRLSMWKQLDNLTNSSKPITKKPIIKDSAKKEKVVKKKKIKKKSKKNKDKDNKDNNEKNKKKKKKKSGSKTEKQ